MDAREAEKALKHLDWTELRRAPIGEKFAALVDGEAVLGETVAKDDHIDSDVATDVFVVVKVANQYFKKSGWLSNDSHCSWVDEDDLTWRYELTEVRPKEKTITVWD